MKKLKPCPCCGSTNLEPPHMHWPEGCVYCRDCGLRTISPEAWNRRTPPASQSDEARVEELTREAYTNIPMRAASPALAELCGVELDDPIPFDVVEAKGGSHEGLRHIIRALLPSIHAREAAESIAGWQRGYEDGQKGKQEAVDAARAEGRREGIEEAAKVIQKRMDGRFEEHGTREPDTNACYYGGRAGETYEALDEEADEVLTLLRALKEKQP